MKRFCNIMCALAMLSFAACQQDDIKPDTPDAPTEGYHLTFDGGVGIETDTRAIWNDDKGSGDLIFQWDYTPEGTEEYEMVMALVGDELFESTEGNYHTYASIHKHGVHPYDAHWATFKTIEKYPYDIFSGVYEGYNVLAVTPICSEANGATVSSNNLDFDVTMPMPATFTQVADQKPDFLRNYMYMYASEMIFDNRATLQFKHIPATFRFIITNKRPMEANIKSVTVSLTDAALPVASKSASINYEGVTFSQDAHTAITTQLGENGTAVQKDAKYTAYALALPLADNTAFNGKQVKFTIEAGEPDNEYLSFVLDAETLAQANPDNEYNWVGGKSYTIRMSLSDGLLVQDITVNDWIETDIDGGVAEECTQE